MSEGDQQVTQNAEDQILAGIKEITVQLRALNGTVSHHAVRLALAEKEIAESTRLGLLMSKTVSEHQTFVDTHRGESDHRSASSSSIRGWSLTILHFVTLLMAIIALIRSTGT